MENAPVEIGDEVITSGTDEIFPPYLPVGKVVEIKKEYLTQKIWVKPYFVDKSIKQLIIIKNTENILEK
jgi:cell shape-determining protein MreC